jgi:hypothetical protein
MASILDRYGIKEVADVTFYKIKEDGTKGDPVLYLDTLKVSTIEQTAEIVDARGGKGNPKLVTWDYGKEITVTIEDALFSAKSMAIMFGNGTATPKASGTVSRTIMARVIDTSEGGTASAYIDYVFVDLYNSTSKSAERYKVDMKETTARANMITLADAIEKGMTITGITAEDGTVITGTFDSVANIKTAVASYGGKKVLISYTVPASKSEIVVSADTFPGTYYVQGDTYARSDVDGSDQFFQFIIEKAKMTSENTITLEAEGDPAVFNMNLTVLRPESGEMMKLVQYDLA